ncbi:MAG TPA: hypothetical protein VGD91_06685 [Trebonia sp.]
MLRQYIEQQNRPAEGTLGPGGPPASAFTTGLSTSAPADKQVA